MTTVNVIIQSKRLENLPLDVLLELVTFLSVPEALSLVSTSQKLHTLRSIRSFWHILIQNFRRSCVPLACPLEVESTQNLEEVALRTWQRQQTLLSPCPSPVRVQEYMHLLSTESISPISGTHLYLTSDFEDGMARCWNLTNGNALAEVYIGRNILAKSTLSAEKGRFLVCLLVAETAREFVATSVVVLCLNYNVSVDDFTTFSCSYSNIRLSITYRSALDVTYPAMYPSCAINEQGLIVISKMATFIHLIAINVNTGVKQVLETDLTEIEVDSVDLAFRDQDLILIASSHRSSRVYSCSRDNLPYSSDSNATAFSHHLNLSLSSSDMPISANIYSYERTGFYASGNRIAKNNTGTISHTSPQYSFATTSYYAITSESEQYTECCFWDCNPVQPDDPASTKPAHKCRLPGLQFFEVPCVGSESGAWGAFVCDVDVDLDQDGSDIGHDFEVDIGVGRSRAAASTTSPGCSQPQKELENSKAEIFFVHYDASTRTSSVHRPILPKLVPGFCDSWLDPPPYSWVNNIQSIEFDERLGILYIMLDVVEGTVLCGMEFS